MADDYKQKWYVHICNIYTSLFTYTNSYRSSSHRNDSLAIDCLMSILTFVSPLSFIRADDHYGGVIPTEKELSQNYWDMVETSNRNSTIDYANGTDRYINLQSVSFTHALCQHSIPIFEAIISYIV